MVEYEGIETKTISPIRELPLQGEGISQTRPCPKKVTLAF